MTFNRRVLEELKAFLPSKAVLLNKEVTSRTAGGLHTEEPIHAELIVRPQTTEEVSRILTDLRQILAISFSKFLTPASLV